MKTFQGLEGPITTNKKTNMDPDCLYCKTKMRACASHMERGDDIGPVKITSTVRGLPLGPLDPGYKWLGGDDYNPMGKVTTSVLNKDIRKGDIWINVGGEDG